MQNRGHMRRALLLTMLLAAPVLARAQAGVPPAGTIYFVNTDADLKATTINVIECSSSTATVRLTWTPTVAGAAYQLYAANKDTATITSSTPSTTDCPTEQATNPSTGTTVIAVGGQITDTSAPGGWAFSTSAMVNALVSTAVPNPCAGSTGTIYLCMQAKNASNANVGVARASITLALTPPDANPTLNTPILPGNKALTPSWGTNGSTGTVWYRAEAVSLADPSVVPTAGAFRPNGSWSGFNPADPNPHFSDYVTGTDARIGGLQNNVAYAIAVVGYTADFNPSDPSNIGTSAPVPVQDFWNIYKAAGGQETGGCSSGLAGPVGLLVLAGALALVRRRK